MTPTIQRLAGHSSDIGEGMTVLRALPTNQRPTRANAGGYTLTRWLRLNAMGDPGTSMPDRRSTWS